jgi:hypothetical protein
VARSILGADAAVRTYLLAEAQAFRRLMVDVLLGDGVESAQHAWTECSKPVDALAAGEVRIARYQLTDEHPMRSLGRPTDDLVLDERDVLRPIPSHQGSRIRRSP